MSSSSSFRSGSPHQQGMVLFMSLVLLFVLTLLSLSSLREAGMQQRMAAAFLDASLAFQAAEAGLREVESLLLNIDMSADWPDGVLPDGVQPRAPPQLPPLWETVDWRNAREAAMDLPGLHDQPRYIIEYLGGVGGTLEAPLGAPLEKTEADGRETPVAQIFRITVVGTGATPASRVVLQSVFGRGTRAASGYDGRLSWRQFQDTGFAH